MAIPTTREEFKQTCLRSLGKGVIDINVTDEQVEDKIDEALKYFVDYHYDATELTYFKHQITATDVTNRYIPVPENIIGAIRIFDTGLGSYSSDVFSDQWQYAANLMNNLLNVPSGGLSDYYINRTNLSLINDLLNGKVPIRFNRHLDRVYIDANWSRFTEGSWIVIEAYSVIDPVTFSDVWADRWLTNYTATLIGIQWGNNLTKFTGMNLPGNVQFNGEAILSRYIEQKKDMEATMMDSYSLPPMGFVG